MLSSVPLTDTDQDLPDFLFISCNPIFITTPLFVAMNWIETKEECDQNATQSTDLIIPRIEFRRRTGGLDNRTAYLDSCHGFVVAISASSEGPTIGTADISR